MCPRVQTSVLSTIWKGNASCGTEIHGLQSTTHICLVRTVVGQPEGGRRVAPLSEALQEAPGSLGTVRNAVLLLELLADGPAYQQLSELADRSSLSLPTVHRLLRSLVLADLVEQDPRSSRYGLGPELTRLSHRYLARLPVLGALAPYLSQLRDEVGWDGPHPAARRHVGRLRRPSGRGRLGAVPPPVRAAAGPAHARRPAARGPRRRRAVEAGSRRRRRADPGVGRVRADRLGRGSFARRRRRGAGSARSRSPFRLWTPAAQPWPPCPRTCRETSGPSAWGPSSTT